MSSSSFEKSQLNGQRNIFCKASTRVLFSAVPSWCLDSTHFSCTSLVCFYKSVLVWQVNSHWLHDFFVSTWLFFANLWFSIKWRKEMSLLSLKKSQLNRQLNMFAVAVLLLLVILCLTNSSPQSLLLFSSSVFDLGKLFRISDASGFDPNFLNPISCITSWIPQASCHTSWVDGTWLVWSGLYLEFSVHYHHDILHF